MLRKSRSLKKVIERKGTIRVKALVTLTIGTVRFPVSTSLCQVLGQDVVDKLEEAEVSVCFERGGKLATSSDYNLKRVKGQQGEEFLEVHINESLSLVVTAYQNTTTMIYQEKTGKVIVRQKKKSLIGGLSHSGMGVVNLDIAAMLNDESKSCQDSTYYPLEKCLVPNASVQFIVETKLLGEMDATDDASTTFSGLSEVSCSAAEFDTSASLSFLQRTHPDALTPFSSSTTTTSTTEKSRRNSKVSPLLQQSFLNSHNFNESSSYNSHGKGKYRSKLDEEMYQRSLQEAEEVKILQKEQIRRSSLRKSVSFKRNDKERSSPMLDTSELADLAITMNFDDEDDFLITPNESPEKDKLKEPKQDVVVDNDDDDDDEKKYLRVQLKEALSDVEQVRKELEKQNTIYTITRKEMFSAQEKVDELNMKLSSIEDVNNQLRENMEKLKNELDVEKSNNEESAQVYQQLVNKMSLQVKLNASLQDQLEQMEDKEYRRDQQMMHKSINMDQSNAQLLEDLKRVRESLFYSEDKVESLKERLQERDKEMDKLRTENVKLLKERDQEVEAKEALRLEYSLLQQHEKKQKVKKDRLKDMLNHSEEIINNRRDELEMLRNDLADAESKVDSLTAETFHLNTGRRQLESTNESLRIQLGATLEKLIDLQNKYGIRKSTDGDNDDNSVSENDEINYDEEFENEDEVTPTKSPSIDIIRQLQRKVEVGNASLKDNELIIKNLNKYIDSNNLENSNKIKELMEENASVKEKLIKLTADHDNLRVNYEESEKKVLSLVSERHNLQTDMESQEAQIVYLKSRERTLNALTSRDSLSNSSPLDNSLKYESDSTSIEMVNTLIVQNKNLLASNMEWEQRYEAMDMSTKAAVKSKNFLTEEVIRLKSEVEQLTKDNRQLQERNDAVTEQAKNAKKQAQLIQKDLLKWRKKYENTVDSKNCSLDDIENDDYSACMGRGIVYGMANGFDSIDNTPKSTTCDSEKDYLIHELIQAKMNAASAALERDSKQAASNSPLADKGQRDNHYEYNSKVEDDLLQQLIDAKMKAASFAMERDEHGRRINGLKRLIQVYAERVATLEVSAARGITPRQVSSDNIITVDAAQAVLLSGTLYKKSSPSLLNPVWKWEKFFFELDCNKISYYDDESGNSKGEFLLNSNTQIIAEDVSKPVRQASGGNAFCSFQLDPGSGSQKKMTIASDSAVELELWIDAIKQAIQKL